MLVRYPASLPRHWCEPKMTHESACLTGRKAIRVIVYGIWIDGLEMIVYVVDACVTPVVQTVK
jgi:hypothetical protein